MPPPPSFLRCTMGCAALAAVAAMAAVSLAGCTPALDWRSVNLPGAQLTPLMPCKPEQATRPIDTGHGVVPLAVAGCSAGGGAWAISHMPLPPQEQAGEALAQWRGAVQARLQAGQAQQMAAFEPPGALPLPTSVRATYQGQHPDGRPLVAHGVWFARIESGQIRLYHAVAMGEKLPADALDMFFASLR